MLNKLQLLLLKQLDYRYPQMLPPEMKKYSYYWVRFDIYPEKIKGKLLEEVILESP